MIVYFFIALYGLSKACSDLRLFWTKNKISSFFAGLQSPKWYRWYEGGNDKYPPSQIWTSDFWHVCEHIKDLCLVGIAISVALQPLDIVYYLPVYWFSGRVFVLFSHYVFRLDPDGSYGHFLLDTILFWKSDLRVT